MENKNIELTNRHIEERIGETKLNYRGDKMKIIEYINYANITIQFEDGYITKTTYKDFKNGTVSNPFHKSIFGVGYIGEKRPRVSSKEYIRKKQTWHDMLKRCYGEKYRYSYSSYVDCSVCDEWHNFQNFSKWYDENYYEIENEKMCLDKDIINKGNKIYSPETCVFTPECINKLFIKHATTRGDYPLGVYKRKRNGKYVAQCKDGISSMQTFLGDFDSVAEAFSTYKAFKEKIIKQRADTYKEYIPEKLYNAMYSYEVEITD